MSSVYSDAGVLAFGESAPVLNHATASAGFSIGSLRWWAIGRLIVIGTIFGLITKYHLIKVWKRYNAKKAMTIHTMMGMIETFKFCIEDVFRDPVPGRTDLVIGMIHNASAVALTTGLLKGNQTWTRPGFQANFVIRITLGLIAYFWQSTAAHRTSVNLNHGAIYIRLGITFLNPFFNSYADLYTAVSLCAGIICFETGSYEGSFAPQGIFIPITLVLVPLVKYLTNLNVDLELDRPVTVKTQSELPAVTVETTLNALQLEDAQPSQLVSLSAETPLLATIRTDMLDMIASPTSPCLLTLSTLQELDNALSPLASQPWKTLHTRDLSQAGSLSPDSPASSSDMRLLTPEAESPPLFTINSGSISDLDQAWVQTPQPKLSLAPINTSIASSDLNHKGGARSAPWTALLRSPSSAFPFSAADTASVKRELRILAARAGLSPLKEWQSIRKWDRARDAAAKAAKAR